MPSIEDLAIPIADQAAEAALVGTMMLSPECIDRLSLPAAAFSDPFYGRAYTTLITLRSAGQAADIGILANSMEIKPGSMEWQRVLGLTKGVLVSDGLGYEARIAASASRRDAQRAAIALLGNLRKPQLGNEQLSESAAGIIRALTPKHSIDTLSVSDLIDLEATARIDEKKKKFKLGFSRLDQEIGLLPGEVLTLIARPAVGKSAIAQCCALSTLFGDPSAVVLYASLEMPATLFWRRCMQISSGLTRRELDYKLEKDLLDVAKYMELFPGLRVTAAPRLSVAELSRILDNQRLRGTPVNAVFIDHADFLTSSGNERASEADKIRKLYADIKSMAKTHSVAVMVLQQAGRAEGGDGEKPLSMSSGRGSAGIEESSDYLLGAWRPELGPELTPSQKESLYGVMVIRVLKARNCGRFDATLFFDGSTLSVTDQTEEK